MDSLDYYCPAFGGAWDAGESRGIFYDNVLKGGLFIDGNLGSRPHGYPQ